MDERVNTTITHVSPISCSKERTAAAWSSRRESSSTAQRVGLQRIKPSTTFLRASTIHSSPIDDWYPVTRSERERHRGHQYIVSYQASKQASKHQSNNLPSHLLNPHGLEQCLRVRLTIDGRDALRVVALLGRCLQRACCRGARRDRIHETQRAVDERVAALHGKLAPFIAGDREVIEVLGRVPKLQRYRLGHEIRNSNQYLRMLLQ